MTPETYHHSYVEPTNSPSVPESIGTASRCELSDIQLKMEGELPTALKGHVFMVAPVGTVNSGGLPYPNGDSVLNGDGMIYRLDFDRPGEVRLTTRLVKPPDYYADLATQPGTKYGKYCFCNHGVARFSFSLGARNELNTAFLPFKFGKNAAERLLVTYDAGRPYEIDTQTLDTIAPVGRNIEWQAAVPLKWPFQSVFSTAHPACDPYTQDIFTVNYGRSITNFLETIPLIQKLSQVPQKIEERLKSAPQFFSKNLIKQLIFLVFQAFERTFQICMGLVEKTTRLENFFYLVRWDGLGELERWSLVLADGSPLKIKQTVHQIGVTKDYIVIMDTAFKTGLGQLINHPFLGINGLAKLLTQWMTCPAEPDSVLYIVRRDDLKIGQYPARSQPEVKVIVRKITIPLASAHFLVDHANPQGNITLHIAHICAMDVAEWIRQYDTSAYPPFNPIPSYVCGLENNETDISRLGRYVINGDSGDIIESKVMSDFDCTWGIELFAYPDRCPKTGVPLDRLENIYWCSYGLWKQLMTKFIVDLHQTYKYRQVPLSEVLDLAEKGVPYYLFRLHTESMTIIDRYEFPPGHLTLSPQFIPRIDSKNSTDGYIICTVWFTTNNEFWLFDANDLAKGPLCKLSHPLLNFGLTLHTAWLANIECREANYYIGVRQDYEDWVKQMCPEIQELFEKEIYPYFEIKA